MNAAHHLDRSRLYLGFVTRNVLAGEYDRAARAVHRAATHAATAAAIHWHHRHHSWRRLTTVLGQLVRDGLLEYRHLRAFPGSSPPTRPAGPNFGDVAGRRRLLRRLRRAIIRAMHADPNPLSLKEILAQMGVSRQAQIHNHHPTPVP